MTNYEFFGRIGEVGIENVDKHRYGYTPRIKSVDFLINFPQTSGTIPHR